MANLKKDPAVIALIEDAVAKAGLAAEKSAARLRADIAKKIKSMALEYVVDAKNAGNKNAGNKDGAKRLMDFANDAAAMAKDQAA